MSEKNMWRTVRSRLKGWDPVRVENPAHPGTPDVNHIHGWLELKWAARWPARPDTVFSLDHYTQQQRTWAERRSRAGGRVLLLLKVGTDWLLYDGAEAAKHLGRLPKGQTMALALKHWPVKLPEKELRCLLKG